MFYKLLPQNIDFYHFFEVHITLTVDCANEFLDLVNKKTITVKDLAHKLKHLEREADQNAHKCIDALRTTFITPFDQNSIHRLITHMDNIIDIMEDVANRMVIYKLDLPTNDMQILVNILCNSIFELQKVIASLRKINFPLIEPIFKTIHLLENEGDSAVINAISNLFENEKDVLTLIKWKEIYERLEDSIDSCEEVAHIVEGLMIENG